MREVTAGLQAGLDALQASVPAGQRAAVEAIKLEVATQRSLLLRELAAALHRQESTY